MESFKGHKGSRRFSGPKCQSRLELLISHASPPHKDGNSSIRLLTLDGKHQLLGC